MRAAVALLLATALCACDGSTAPCNEPGARLVGLEYPAPPTMAQQAAVLKVPGCVSRYLVFANAFWVITDRPTAEFEPLDGVNGALDYATIGDSSRVDLAIYPSGPPSTADTLYLRSLGGRGSYFGDMDWILAVVPLGKVPGLASHPGFARFEVSLTYAVEAARAAP